jgi:hypothetical protein
MPRYCVVFSAYGYVEVDAVSDDDAISKAEEIYSWNDFEEPEYVRVELLEEGSDD